MHVPATPQTPWYQSESVLFTNRVGYALADETSETLFFNLSTLTQPGIQARVVSSKHQISKNKSYLVLTCEQCLPVSEGPAVQFPVLIPFEIESPVEQIENMRIVKTRKNPLVAFIAAILHL